MNLPTHFHLAPLVPLATIALLWCFAMDMRSILKSDQQKNRLSIEGRWEDLERHFVRASKPRRPFVWLHRRYLMPGNDTIQYALFLFKQGRLEEALARVDQAVQQISAKPWFFRSIHRSATFASLCGAFRTRTLVLTGLGRYDEAREAAAQLERLAGSNGRPNAPLALLEYYCGRLDEALALAQSVPPGDKEYDPMRGITALALCAKGEFDAAIQALLYEPGDIAKYYPHGGLETVGQTPEGAKLIELQRQKLAGIFQPARLLGLARVYLVREEFENAARLLDQTEKSLGPEPGLQASYFGQRACALAGQGKTGETEQYIQCMRVLARQLSKRSMLCETQFAAGQAYFYLGRFGDALAELIEAWKYVLHPMEKHSTAYWIARIHEAAGHPREALPYYQMVAADSIPTWMRMRAAEALAALKR